MNRTSRSLGRIAAALLVFGVCASANAATYSYFQDGYAGGGVVSGSFTGEDADLDGFLDETELSALSFSFTGDFSLADLSLGLSDLVDFGFDLTGDAFIGIDPGEGIVLNRDTGGVLDVRYAAGVLVTPGFCIIAQCSEVYDGTFNVATSDSQIAVELAAPAEVPLPAALPLFLAGLAGLGLAKRRRDYGGRQGAAS